MIWFLHEFEILNQITYFHGQTVTVVQYCLNVCVSDMEIIIVHIVSLLSNNTLPHPQVFEMMKRYFRNRQSLLFELIYHLYTSLRCPLTHGYDYQKAKQQYISNVKNHFNMNQFIINISVAFHFIRDGSHILPYFQCDALLH